MTQPTETNDRPLAQRLGEALGEAYTTEGEIGRGGMGVVYRARDERLHRRVAIKVLPPELAFQIGYSGAFAREAQTAGHHRNLSRIRTSPPHPENPARPRGGPGRSPDIRSAAPVSRRPFGFIHYDLLPLIVENFKNISEGDVL